MRIGILTQPLFTNYGGLLQAYALQTVLERMGHDVTIIRRDPPFLSLRFPNSIILDLKYGINKLLHRQFKARSARQIRFISRETSRFVDQYLHVTKSLYTDKQLYDYASKHGCDAYIVGSDQVWRPSMSPNILNFYLDFLSDDIVKRIAYAVSFGVDDWEYTDDQTFSCRTLAKKFDAISVREKSGIEICHRYLDVDAVHVLDPTILLSSNEYESLVAIDGVSIRDGDLFCYILNENNNTLLCREAIKTATCYNEYDCMPRFDGTPQNIEKHEQSCVFPPVSQWIRSFMDAKMVFTDSFHGTAFSIIFNKPFWVIGNSLRGMSRLESLLEMFNLEERLVSPDKIVNTDWNRKIDWDDVNSRKKGYQSYSLSFLNNALK